MSTQTSSGHYWVRLSEASPIGISAGRCSRSASAHDIGRPLSLCRSAPLFCSTGWPFHFSAHGRPVGWIPFFSSGSLDVNIMSFPEKAFLYGSLIWLLDRTGLGLAKSVVLVAVILSATSWAETYLPESISGDHRPADWRDHRGHGKRNQAPRSIR